MRTFVGILVIVVGSLLRASQCSNHNSLGRPPKSLIENVSNGSIRKLTKLQPELLEQVVQAVLDSPDSKNLSSRIDNETSLILYTLSLKILVPLTYQIVLLNSTVSPEYKAQLLEHVLWEDGDLITPRSDLSKKGRSALFFLWRLQGGSSTALRNEECILPTGTMPNLVLVLHHAILHNDVSKRLSIVKRFIKHGANINARDAFGRTPLFYAILEGYSDIIHLLLRLDADISILDDTPKGLSISEQLKFAKECLWKKPLEIKALLESHTIEHRTAYDYARLCDNLEIVALLEKNRPKT